MRRQTKKKIRQLWGYVVLAAVAYGWFGAGMGPGVIAVLSGVVILYTLFQAPMWCCADTRTGEPCRNNSYGILLGCQLRQHKWQKTRMLFRADSWSSLVRRVWSSIGGASASISALAGTASAIIALVAVAQQ